MPATVDANARLLVTGASGQLGQLVLTHLLDTLKVSPGNIVAGSRSPDKLQAFVDRGVLTRRLDFDDAASVEAAAQGVDRALLISAHDIFNRVPGHKNAITAMVAAGVKQILYTSFLNVENATALIAVDHLETEQLIRKSGVAGFTFLRNAIYYDNQAVWIAASHRSGQWATASHGGKLAGISRDDAALAAATALASDNYENQIYDLSSIESLTVAETVANISKAIGKPIEAVDVEEEVLIKGIQAATGVPEETAKIFATLDSHTFAGLSEARGEDFFKLVGRHPLTHAQWVENNKERLAAA
jgi:NAD(P)H dehydrogenase (quinone)